MSHRTVNVVIASPLEADLVERIRQVDPRVEVMYDPDLLARPRYAADHVGVFAALTPVQDRRWHEMLARAEVSFDFDRREPSLAAQNFPALRWLQASSAGVGQIVPRFTLDLSRVTVTTAAGVHAIPLSEFVLTGLLYFTKEIWRLRRWQSEHQWTRYTADSVSGKRVLVVGLGQVGRLTAIRLAALGVEVLGAVRTVDGPDLPGVASTVSFHSILDVVSTVDAIVLACPLTPETEGLISAECLRAMKPGAILVNIARGQVVDEVAMVEALRSGHLAGAALDVATVEPLPDDSPLWDLDNVLISPHSASTTAAENRLITDLFCENLRRWLRDEPLVNVYRPERGY